MEKNWIHPNPHELEVKPISAKLIFSWMVEYKVVKERVVELIKDMPPTQLGHLNNISRTKYNIKRQIQLTMHMREEPKQKGFYMMLKCKVA